MAITTPSYAWERSRSPSTTFTCTTTVSPGLKSGTSRVMRALLISSMILLMSLTSILVPGRLGGQQLIQCPLRLGGEPPAAQQVGPAPPGPLHRTRQAPAADIGMVAGQ